MIISKATVNRADRKSVIQCVLNAGQHVGIHVTGLVNFRRQENK